MMRPINLVDNKRSTGTDYAYFKDLLAKAHSNIMESGKEAIVEKEVFDKLNENPDLIEEILARQTKKIKPKHPCIYYVNPNVIEGVRAKESMDRLGVSYRSVREIRMGHPLSIVSIKKMLRATNLTLKELLTEECYKEKKYLKV